MPSGAWVHGRSKQNPHRNEGQSLNKTYFKEAIYKRHS